MHGNMKHFLLYLVICIFKLHAFARISQHSRVDSANTANSRVNVLIILADDLGYGDTSVYPFMGSGIYTPELEKMASRGVIMSNFHSAAAVCTPTRASIITGMFPWRLGIKGVYEYGEKGKSNRDDWLALTPTIAMAFRDAGYVTGHSGKWHVGGMRNDDLEMRLQPSVNNSNEIEGYSIPGNRRCPHPGPNQQGFEEYVSVLDGPGSVRQGELQISSVLYSLGCNHLLNNDRNIGSSGRPKAGNEYLFDCEVRHAIRMMKASKELGKPFFIQVWFHAPHGPWEYIPEYMSWYDKSKEARYQQCMEKHNSNKMYCDLAVKPKRMSEQFSKYNTMVSGMDNSIGTLLQALKSLGIERDTIVVFVSDNGPEVEAGTVGSPERSTSGLRGNKRYLYEGGIRVPCIWQWEGTFPKGKESTVLGVTVDILPTVLDAANVQLPPTARIDGISLLAELKGNKKRRNRIYTDRMSLWHAEYEGPRSTATIIYDYKVKLNDKDHPFEIFDLVNDVNENNNLLPNLGTTPLADIIAWQNEYVIQRIVPRYLLTNESRSDPAVHKLIVSKTYQILYDFANFGNEAHKIYLEHNPGRIYKPTVESDSRNIGNNIYRKISKSQADIIREVTITNGSCSTPCSCRIPYGRNTPTLPFSQVARERRYLNPHGLINGTALLFDSRYYRLSAGHKQMIPSVGHVKPRVIDETSAIKGSPDGDASQGQTHRLKQILHKLSVNKDQK